MTTMHRETLNTEAGEYVVIFHQKVADLSNGGKRITLCVTKDEKDAQPETVTLWLNKDEKAPANKTAICAMIERSKVTNMANGREYFNADVRTWTLA